MSCAPAEVNVTVKDLTGKTYPLRLSLSIPGKELKAIVREICGEQYYPLRLIHAGKLVSDKKLLADINMKDGDVLHVVHFCRLSSVQYPRFVSYWLSSAAKRRILFELVYIQRLIRDPNPLITDFRPVMALLSGDLDRYVACATRKAFKEGPLNSGADWGTTYSDWLKEEVNMTW